jgi:hypothetical protein
MAPKVLRRVRAALQTVKERSEGRSASRKNTMVRLAEYSVRLRRRWDEPMFLLGFLALELFEKLLDSVEAHAGTAAYRIIRLFHALIGIHNPLHIRLYEQPCYVGNDYEHYYPKDEFENPAYKRITSHCFQHVVILLCELVEFIHFLLVHAK